MLGGGGKCAATTATSTNIGNAAVTAQFKMLYQIALDSRGNVYIAGGTNNVVYELYTYGMITIITVF